MVLPGTQWNALENRTLDLRLERLGVGRLGSGVAGVMRPGCDLSGAVVSTEGQAS